MPERPEVFISATTRDLGSFREAVADVLLTLGAHPVTQEHFEPDYRRVVALLRDKLRPCDAMICLIGRRYGAEPLRREPSEPRWSYTQLEYEIAVELKKHVFIFVASDDCPLDAAPDEPDELRALQLDYVKRIVATDQIRMMFHSLGHLTDQVRVMRFDPESLAQGVTTRLVVLLFAELIDTEAIRKQRDELVWVRDVVQPFQAMLQELLPRWRGRLKSETSSEYKVNFETADDAVNAALAMHESVRRHDWQGPPPGLRVGIHIGQIVQFGGVDESRVLQASHAMDECQHLTRLAEAGQTLLTRTAFDIARERVHEAPSSGGDTVLPLRWLAHGRYQVAGADEPLDVCEVGVAGLAPLAAPAESAEVQRADSLEERRMRGWCPAPGQEIPRRSGWFVERKLGEGGFGEVWVARHDRTRDLRVFKFCFDADRLTSFKRELTLFKLLRDALGKREDIAELLEVELGQPPFFLESEYVEGGNLRDWGEAAGRLVSLPLEERLRLVAEIGRAVAAAHSVGIIHKDLKPRNIFMRQDSDGRWHPILADFGIGAIADRSQLERRGITVTGFTRTILEPGSSRTGTRMYQPPEASVGRTATVQGDVYALGVLLYQMVMGDFDQPLGIGWERGLDVVFVGQGGEAHNELTLGLLKQDIGACVDGDPSARLASVAQLVERLQTLDKRVADTLVRHRAERARVRMRRLRAALAASIAALIVVGGLGAFAFTEWRLAKSLKDKAEQARQDADQNAEQATRNAKRAVENEERATKSEKQAVENEKRAEESAKKAQASAESARHQSQLALDTLNAMIFDIQQSVMNLSGSSPIRRRLLTTALARLEKLSGEFVQRSTADRHTAVALASMGDLVLQFGEAPRSQDARGATGPGPGELRGAAESARRLYMSSMEIFQALAKADPNNAQAQRDLSVSYNKLGDVHLKLGATDKALQSYQSGLKLSEALAKADPNNVEAQRDLSVSYNKLGDVHLQLGATDKALQSYQSGLKLREALAKADPNNAQAQRDLSISYSNLGNVHLKLGVTDKALQSYQSGLKLSEALAKADPNNVEAQRDLSVSYEKLGDVHLQLGATDKALQSYESGLKLREALAKADPNNAQAQRDLSVSYEKLGDVHLKLRATDKALEYLQKDLKLSEALAKADPANVQAQQDLSGSFYKMAQAHERANDLVRARAWYEKMLGVDRELSQRFPQSAAARGEVASDMELLSRICAGSQDWKAAESYARQSLDHARAPRLISGTDQPFQWDFSITLRRLGIAQAGAGHLRAARQSYEEAVQAGPKSAAAHSALAWLLATCWDDSVRDGKKAVEVATKLCELSEWKKPDSLDTLAAAYGEAGQFEEALKWEKKAIDLQKDATEKAAYDTRLKLYEEHKPYHQPRPEAAPRPEAEAKPSSR